MKDILKEFTNVNLMNVKNEVSASKGIYLWTTQNDEIVYIGIALGKKWIETQNLQSTFKPRVPRIQRNKAQL